MLDHDQTQTPLDLACSREDPPFVLAIAGAPARRYHSATDLAWDRTLEPERQISALEKWLKLETDRYVQERETASLLRMREIKGVLKLVRRVRGE